MYSRWPILARTCFLTRVSVCWESVPNLRNCCEDLLIVNVCTLPGFVNVIISAFFVKEYFPVRIFWIESAKFQPSCLRSQCLSMADRRPLSIQESTYFVGSNSFWGGPTSLTKSGEEMIFVSNDARDGVAVRFICENPRSHSLEEIGIVDRACCSATKLKCAIIQWKK